MTARTRIAAIALVTVAIACHDSQRSVPPTLDAFYYPTGLAVRHDCTDAAGCQNFPEGSFVTGCIPGTPGCQSQLLVASSNFDLRYDPLNGGTMLAVDVDRALGVDPNAAAGPFLPGAKLGALAMGSFAGEVAVLDQQSCPTWSDTPQVLVASRAQNALYRLDVGADGSLSCRPGGCSVPLVSTLADAYGVTVVCGNVAAAGGGAPGPRNLAFVTYLRAPSFEGFVSRIDLGTDLDSAVFDSSAIETTYDVGAEPTQHTAFDKDRGLLFMSERFATIGVARLRWLDLAFPQLGVGTVDYGPIVRGAELVTLALSSDSPPSRAYVAARLYDVDTATSTGARPQGDVGAALLVLDLNAVLSGAPAADTVRSVVHLDRGPAAIAVIPRLDPATGKPQVDANGNPLDLVAVTSSDDGTMTLYDNAVGQAAMVFRVCDSGAPVDAKAPATCPPGFPSLGRQPYGIAWESYQPGTQPLVRLFVGSFDRSWVNAIVLDPANPAAPVSWARIGPERSF